MNKIPREEREIHPKWIEFKVMGGRPSVVADVLGLNRVYVRQMACGMAKTSMRVLVTIDSLMRTMRNGRNIKVVYARNKRETV